MTLIPPFLADFYGRLFLPVSFGQASWCLKTRALTEQVYVDEVDVDEEGIAEMLMDDNAVAQLPRQYISYFSFLL